MAKKLSPPPNQHTCGECRRGTWSDRHTNYDVFGKPFVKICEFATFALNARGEKVTLRSTIACDHYK